MKKFRTKIPDSEVFLYGFCYFDAICTKTIEMAVGRNTYDVQIL